MSRLDDDFTAEERRGLRRREALGLLGGGLVAVGGGGAVARLLGGDVETAQAAQCILTPEVTEGPYWIDTDLTRRDVREGKAGLPLELVLTIQNAKSCKPIAHADVEIWHCDATGEYSGFDGATDGGGAPRPGESAGAATTTRYLRGHQRANAKGAATFLTIFPGWYAGRTPHIHLKVHVGGAVVHTGQVFFSERVQRSVYQRSPYRTHGQPDTSHAEDQIYAQAGSAKAQLTLARRASGGGYKGTITLGVAT